MKGIASIEARKPLILQGLRGFGGDFAFHRRWNQKDNNKYC